MLICEELFLLLTKDDGMPESLGVYKPYGMGGAVIGDLMLAGRLELEDGDDPRVRVRSAEPTGNPVLDRSLARIVERDGKRLSTLLMDRRVNPEKAVVSSLADARIITIRPRKILGLMPERHPVVDPAPERAIRARLAGVLAGDEPRPADVVLLTLLQGVGHASKVLREEVGKLSPAELEERIDTVADRLPDADAIGRTITQMTGALVGSLAVAANGGDGTDTG